jgi:hypothetical protein
MKKNILMGLCLGILLVVPNVVLAGCADLGGFTNFSVTDNTVTLYSGKTPYAKFDVLCDVQVQPKSRLQLIKSYMCDGDEVLVAGFKCTILNITSPL